MNHIQIFDESFIFPKGFFGSITQAGIKYEGRDDLMLLYSDTPCKAAGVFTKNKVKAAPVVWDMHLVHAGECVRAILTNTGIANASTGQAGLDICKSQAKNLAAELNIAADEVLIGSTGVIGMQIPLDKMTAGILCLKEGLSDSAETGHRAASAMMTTDTVSKEITVKAVIGGKEVVMAGMAKGSGMIHPDMCTMLVYITTDCDIDLPLLQAALLADVPDSFNMISVDGDTSTNDTVLLLSNGLAGNVKITKKDDDYMAFCNMLSTVTKALSKKIASDGEGATKLIECSVNHAISLKDAKLLAKAVITSSLVKAAFYGNDANWGRILCALGYSGGDFKPDSVNVSFMSKKGSVTVCKNGLGTDFDEAIATDVLKADSVRIDIDLQDGNFTATAWGCDLSYDYVKINADYRS